MDQVVPEMRTVEPNPLPREVASGVYWLGDCIKVTYAGRTLHAYDSVFLIAGEHSSMLVEAGHPQDMHLVERQVNMLLERGVPDLKYLFLTHTETPHAGGVGRLLDRFPDTLACGDTVDLHLVFPQFADRLLPLDPGDTLDLGGRTFTTVEAVFRDHITTRWGFDTKAKVLFAGDGFSYSHYHEAGHCGRLAEEVTEIDMRDMVAQFAEAAFNWTTYTDIEPYLARLDELIFTELRAVMIAPTHGLPIADPIATLPSIRDGLRTSSNTAGQRTASPTGAST
jgi:flavorubredoxin